MASTLNLLLFSFFFLLLSTVSSHPPFPSPSPAPPPRAAEPPLLPPESSPKKIAPPPPLVQERVNSSREFAFHNVSTPPPSPGTPELLNSSHGFTARDASRAPPPLPAIQESGNSTRGFRFSNSSAPPPLPAIQEPGNSSRGFSFSNSSAPLPLPRTQELLNHSHGFSFHNTSSIPPLPRAQAPLNSSRGYSFHNTSSVPPLPRAQEPLNSAEEFILNSTFHPFLPPLPIIETTKPTPPPPPAVATPLNLSAVTALPTRAPLVPAFFILGDSSVDSGTNNYLGTLARADRPPYGRDFDTHQPTGRFCNGRIPVDFLALRLGLPFVPSYLGQNGTVKDMIQGVNYASAGAGIIFSSGLELGQRVSFTQQIQQFTDTLQTFIVEMGEDAATDLISKSVFYVSVGINDYIHYYLRNVSNVQNLYLPWSFNQFLAYSLKNEIKNLYAMSVRKVVVTGLPPIGCAPHYLWRYRSRNGKCIQEINDMILEFNFVMRYIVQGLNAELPGAAVIFCDVYEASMDIMEKSAQYGFNVTAEACCGWGRYRGWIMCISPEMACDDASNHVWWDQYHPTDAVNAIIADDVWNGVHTKICYPMSLEEMVTVKTN